MLQAWACLALVLTYLLTYLLACLFYYLLVYLLTYLQYVLAYYLHYVYAVVVCQLVYNGVQWKGDFVVAQQPTEYDAVLLATTDTEPTMIMV